MPVEPIAHFPKAADGEFDAAAGVFAPGFEFRHVGRFRELAK
jgi:hypothetical protein